MSELYELERKCSTDECDHEIIDVKNSVSSFDSVCRKYRLYLCYMRLYVVVANTCVMLSCCWLTRSTGTDTAYESQVLRSVSGQYYSSVGDLPAKTKNFNSLVGYQCFRYWRIWSGRKHFYVRSGDDSISLLVTLLPLLHFSAFAWISKINDRMSSCISINFDHLSWKWKLKLKQFTIHWRCSSAPCHIDEHPILLQFQRHKKSVIKFTFA